MPILSPFSCVILKKFRGQCDRMRMCRTKIAMPLGNARCEKAIYPTLKVTNPTIYSAYSNPFSGLRFGAKGIRISGHTRKFRFAGGGIQTQLNSGPY